MDETPKAPPEILLLVVDDEPDILESLGNLLHHEFPSVRLVEETDPVLALDHLHDPNLRVVLADYRMPGLNGVDFLLQARRMAPQATRVLITAFAGEALKTRPDLKAAADVVWMKPLETKPFVDRIASLLGEPR